MTVNVEFMGVLFCILFCIFCTYLHDDAGRVVETNGSIALKTNVHDDGLSPSVMKALATEPRRHRGKAFFSSPCLCASVAIFFHGKDKTKIRTPINVTVVVEFNRRKGGTRR